MRNDKPEIEYQNPKQTNHRSILKNKIRKQKKNTGIRNQKSELRNQKS